MQILINILAGLSTLTCLYWFIRQIKLDRAEAKERIQKAAEERKQQKRIQFAKDYIQFRKEIHGE